DRAADPGDAVPGRTHAGRQCRPAGADRGCGAVLCAVCGDCLSGSVEGRDRGHPLHGRQHFYHHFQGSHSRGRAGAGVGAHRYPDFPCRLHRHGRRHRCRGPRPPGLSRRLPAQQWRRHAGRHWNGPRHRLRHSIYRRPDDPKSRQAITPKELILAKTSFITAAVLAAAVLATPAMAQTKLVVGASYVPHAEILEQAAPILAAEGIELEIIPFQDYILPNTALDSGEIDANYFQHVPYLNEVLADNPDYDFVNAGGIHVEPIGLYSLRDRKSTR